MFRKMIETITGDARVREDNAALQKQLTDQQWHYTRQSKKLNSQLADAKRKIAALEKELATTRLQLSE